MLSKLDVTIVEKDDDEGLEVKSLRRGSTNEAILEHGFQKKPLLQNGDLEGSQNLGSTTQIHFK